MMPTNGAEPDTRPATIVVVRHVGDHRRLEVPLGVVHGWHMSSASGGHGAPLSRPSLAAYMSCEHIPNGSDFPHSCVHGPGPHEIKVFAVKAHNNAATYRRLREAVEEQSGSHRL